MMDFVKSGPGVDTTCGALWSTRTDCAIMGGQYWITVLCRRWRDQLRKRAKVAEKLRRRINRRGESTDGPRITARLQLMSGYTNFVVVGAGAIGNYIVQQLLKDKAAGIVKEVVVLTRQVNYPFNT